MALNVGCKGYLTERQSRHDGEPLHHEGVQREEPLDRRGIEQLGAVDRVDPQAPVGAQHVDFEIETGRAGRNLVRLPSQTASVECTNERVLGAKGHLKEWMPIQRTLSP